MAINFDTAINRQVDVGVTSVTRSFTTTGSDRYLVAISSLAGTSDDLLTGVTYNGVAMTRGLTVTGTGKRLYIYTLANPAVGTNDIVWSLSMSTILITRAGSYTGATQLTSTPDSSNTLVETSSGNRSISTTTVADNCWLVGTESNSVADPDAVLNGVIRSGGDSGFSTPGYADSNGPKTPAGSNSIGWNFPSSGEIVMGVVSIAPAAGVVVVSQSNGSLLTLGVGN